MKKLMLFLPVILAFFSSTYAFAGRTEVNIKTDTDGGGVSMPRMPPVRCFADKDAGYVELHLSFRLGEVSITLTDSIGNVVDEIFIDTTIESFVTLLIPYIQDSYILRVEGHQYTGSGYID